MVGFPCKKQQITAFTQEIEHPYYSKRTFTGNSHISGRKTMVFRSIFQYVPLNWSCGNHMFPYFPIFSPHFPMRFPRVSFLFSGTDGPTLDFLRVRPSGTPGLLSRCAARSHSHKHLTWKETEASKCQWIGLRENLQESPIFNGKIYGFL